MKFQKIKRYDKDSEKVSASHIGLVPKIYTGLVSEIYTGISLFNQKREIMRLKYWQKICIDITPKKMYEWPINV